MKVLFALLCACALACGHAAKSSPGSPNATATSRRPPVLPPPPDDPRDFAKELSEETRALLRAEGDLLWTRWTTGSGPLPATALQDHPRLLQREANDFPTEARRHRRDEQVPLPFGKQVAGIEGHARGRN